MSTEPEAHVLFRDADELVLLPIPVANGVRRIRCAQLVEAVRIECLCVSRRS